MSKAAYLSAVLSSLWRICIYIFLRIIPTSLCKKILPPLWLLYMLAWFISPVPGQHEAQKLQLDTEIPPQTQSPESDSKDGRPVSESLSVDQIAPIPAPKPPPPSNPLTTLVFSLPSRSPFLRTANLVINILLLLASLELVVYPLVDDAASVTFTRLGAVYPDSVKITVRYPSPVPNAESHDVRIVWRQVSTLQEGIWQDGPFLRLTPDRDWVETARLEGLWPSAAYEYKLMNSTSILPYPENPIRFKTFPDPRLPTGTQFRFLVSSCLTPNFPYAPLHGRRIKGFDLLADYLWPPPAPPATHPITQSFVNLAAQVSAVPFASKIMSIFPEAHSVRPARDLSESHLSPEFMLFLGDFIYADVPFYFGDDQNMYRQFYRRNYQSPSFRKVYERLPMFHVYDDHDIKNNYVGQGNDTQSPFQNASNAFGLYSAEANYEPSTDEQTYYYDFRYGDVAFFVLDTRRYRSEPMGDPATRSMLGEVQLAALHDWLGRVNTTTTFKFIVSSVPFTSLWQMDAQVDSWAAYPQEKAELLEKLYTVPNVIILSGDRHEFAAIEFAGPDSPHKVLEVSTSPFSMFWIPFVRTLKMESEEKVQHTKFNASGDAILEEIPRERVLKYIAQGNYKWSSFEVDTRDLERPTVHLEVMVDGAAAYRLSIVGQPALLSASTALGSRVPQTFRDLLDKMGLFPSRWF